jgi:hypothetical protein
MQGVAQVGRVVISQDLDSGVQWVEVVAEVVVPLFQPEQETAYLEI